MDAWIRNIMKSMAFASGSSRESSFEPEILLCKRSRTSTSSATTILSAASLSSASASSRSYEIQQQVNNTNNNTSNKCSKTSESRIANWDKKREKCRNCALIYLKTLSRHPGFCSVDCKSNATYLEKVNRTIRAMKDAVEQRQQHEKDEAVKAAAAQAEEVVVRAPQPQAEEEPVEDEDEEDDAGRTPQAAHTFSEFGLESRILDASNVEWAFSALY